jgi:hypothetical protein
MSVAVDWTVIGTICSALIVCRFKPGAGAFVTAFQPVRLPTQTEDTLSG